ncbi:MAG: hypothetical protein H0W37_04380 [Pseudonocardiales bacterium]|jgi:hypothetical protein|nr:hypothetical protein [Pseudonocardiales bacterium]
MLHRSETGQGGVVKVPGSVVAATGCGDGQLGMPQRPGHPRSGDARLNQRREHGRAFRCLGEWDLAPVAVCTLALL